MEDTKLATEFWVIGINYRKSDSTLRGRYAVQEEQYKQILETAHAFGVTGLFLLSTCNRTEMFGQASDVQNMMRLLCSQTEGSLADFTAGAYQKRGKDALDHFFQVVTGMDSQILGDYEIVGQIKAAFHFARMAGHTNIFLDRLFNAGLQCARAVRAETNFSSGSVSVAFAAVQFLRSRRPLKGTKILILGSGEIGSSTCRNLLATKEEPDITLMNRTSEKVAAFAQEMSLPWMPITMLRTYVALSDVVIVATSAAQPLLRVDDCPSGAEKIFIDLSIPHNIDPQLRFIKGITLANVDDLSLIKDETLRKRQAEIPAVKDLIRTHRDDFLSWCAMQQHVPVLKAVKEKLHTLNRQITEAGLDPCGHGVQKALNKMAHKLRTEETRPGCNYIETIYHYLSEKNV